MPARTRVVPLLVRSAVLAAAVAVVLLAPAPGTPGTSTPAATPAATFRAAAGDPDPARRHLSPVRIVLVTLLLACGVLELRPRRQPWR